MTHLSTLVRATGQTSAAGAAVVAATIAAAAAAAAAAAGVRCWGPALSLPVMYGLRV
jgi:hypothetical protein